MGSIRYILIIVALVVSSPLHATDVAVLFDYSGSMRDNLEALDSMEKGVIDSILDGRVNEDDWDVKSREDDIFSAFRRQEQSLMERGDKFLVIAFYGLSDFPCMCEEYTREDAERLLEGYYPSYATVTDRKTHWELARAVAIDRLAAETHRNTFYIFMLSDYVGDYGGMPERYKELHDRINTKYSMDEIFVMRWRQSQIPPEVYLRVFKVVETTIVEPPPEPELPPEPPSELEPKLEVRLLTPKNGQKFSSNEGIRFSWKPILEAKRYNLKVWRESGGKKGTFIERSLDKANYFHKKLKKGNYSCQVLALMDNGQLLRSGTQKFKVRGLDIWDVLGPLLVIGLIAASITMIVIRGPQLKGLLQKVWKRVGGERL